MFLYQDNQDLLINMRLSIDAFARPRSPGPLMASAAVAVAGGTATAARAVIMTMLIATLLLRGSGAGSALAAPASTASVHDAAATPVDELGDNELYQNKHYQYKDLQN